MATDEMPAQTPHDRIRNLSDYRDFLAADLVAHGERRWNPAMVISRPELHYQRVLRRAEFLRTKRSVLGRIGFALTRVYLARLSLQSGISIPLYVFGRGLSIAHYGSIVVNDRARVGRFCRIHSATNIGEQGGEAPVIGDFAYIGPGAVIYGATRIGDRVAIGANSVVSGGFDSDSTIGGVPARTLSRTGSANVLPDWFPVDAARTHPETDVTSDG
jgi:serine O-acetyltransferase